MKNRLIGAAIIFGISIPVIFYANNIVFTMAVTIMGLISVNELVSAKKRVPKLVVLFLYSIMIFVCWYSYKWGILESYYYIMAFAGISVMLVLTKNLEKFNFEDASAIFTMIFFLMVSYNSMIYMKINYSLLIFFYPVLIAIFTDTFGFIGGSLFGKHKLIKNISPNKTIEGAVVATLAGLIFSYFYLQQLDFTTLTIIVVSVIMVVLSQFGDLFASSIKRTYNIKDYSKLIPGHGGILDRFDSVLFNFIILFIIFIYV